MSSPADRKRKLIFLWTYTHWGGAQIYFFSIMKAAGPEWDLLVLLPRDSKQDLLRFLDELNVEYEFLPISHDPGPEPTLLGKLRRQFARIQSEVSVIYRLRNFPLRDCILHIETAPWQSWILLSILSVLGANVFVTLHNLPLKAPRWRELVWWARFQIVSRLPGFHLFSSNQDTKNKLRSLVPENFWQRIEVTYTCVDPLQIQAALHADFDRAGERKSLGIPSNAFVVLAVGQFIDRKGRWVFLDAARRIQTIDPDIHFVWVMPRPLSVEERERVDSFGLRNRFHPVLSSSIASDRVSILKFFRIGDVFALPSFVEGLPIALLEAMALGVPSISTGIYAIPEAIKNERTGLIVNAGDASELAHAIVRLFKDLDLRAQLSMQGKDFVLRNFDERVAARKCLKAYAACF